MGHGDDEPPQVLFFAHPAGGETYLTTSDIVVSGAISSPDTAFAVYLHDSKGTAWQSAGRGRGPDTFERRWAIRLTYPEPWGEEGEHRVEFTTARNLKDSTTINIINDARHRAAGRLEMVTALSDEEVEALPVVSFPESTVTTIDVDAPKVIRQKAPLENEKQSAKLGSLPLGQPFALAGTIHFEKAAKGKFAPVVLQIVDPRKTDDGKKLDVIVNEIVAEPAETKTGFEFAKALLAPRVEGRYVLRALYRRAKLCETLIEVKSDRDSK